MIGFDTSVNIVGNIVGKNKLTTIQIKIIELMQSNPKITAKSIAEKIGIAPRNVQVHIQSLKKIGLVERMGAAKGGYWVTKQ